MIIMSTRVEVGGLSGRSVSAFMLNCNDQEYQDWWPGTHFAFHTKKRFPGDLGNLVYFDEYVGKRRLKFEGIVIKNIPGKQIVWQMKKLVRLPAWLVLELDESDHALTITHTMKAGFAGAGSLFDPFLRLFLTKEFEKDLEEHARIEFNKLSDILS